MAVHFQRRKIWPVSYVEFHGWSAELRDVSEGSPSFKELDQYLWIAGMYREFRLTGGRYLSRDAKTLFMRTEPELLEALRGLAG